MEWYHFVMAGAAIAAALVARKTPRAALWVVAFAASFIVSVGYLRGYESLEANNLLAFYTDRTWDLIPLFRDWLPPSIVAAACDAIVCILIYRMGRERWERLWLYGIALAMMGTNLLYASGLVMGFPPIPDRGTLGIILEVMNLAALGLIGGTGILDRVQHGRGGIGGLVGRVFHVGYSYLRAPAKRPHRH
jgi:hypothetical protein